MGRHLTFTSGNSHLLLPTTHTHTTYLQMPKKYVLPNRHLVSVGLKKKHGLCILTDKNLNHGTAAYWPSDLGQIACSL